MIIAVGLKSVYVKYNITYQTLYRKQLSIEETMLFDNK